MFEDLFDLVPVEIGDLAGFHGGEHLAGEGRSAAGATGAALDRRDGRDRQRCGRSVGGELLGEFEPETGDEVGGVCQLAAVVKREVVA